MENENEKIPDNVHLIRMLEAAACLTKEVCDELPVPPERAYALNLLRSGDVNLHYHLRFKPLPKLTCVLISTNGDLLGQLFELRGTYVDVH